MEFLKRTLSIGQIICHKQFQSAFTRETDFEIPLKGPSPFTAMGEYTVDPKGVLKLLNGLKVHTESGPDGLSARVFKESSSEIAPILAYIYNESLAQGNVPDDWRQANVAPVFKKVRNMTPQIIDPCRLLASVARPLSI